MGSAPRAGREEATSRSRSRPYVGRERELEELTDALDDTVAGSGELFVVSGPSGIGKTRLAEELAARAELREIRVLWGRSTEDPGSPPFWPWTQILRGLGSADEASQALQLDLGPGDLDASDRFRLFDLVRDQLLEAGRSSTLLLLLDAVQFADASSIRLLEFIAQTVRDEPLAIVALVRDGFDADMERAQRLIALGRLGRSLPLRGLSHRELLRFVKVRFGIERNDDYGIFLDGLAATTVSANNASANDFDGIRISGGSGYVVGKNKTHENGRHGISSSSAGLTLKKNVASRNGFLGGPPDADGIGLGVDVPAGTTNAGNKAKGNDDPNECEAADVTSCHVS